MEEDIKILEEWVEVDRRTRNNSMESDFDKFCEEKNVAIENLINRVKDLEEAVDNFMRGKAYSTKQLENLKKNFIQKSKIREKIEELDKMMDKINQGELQNYTVGELLSFKAIYKELLEDK